MPSDSQRGFPAAGHLVRRRPSGGGISARQIECLYWAQQGKSAADIGVILGISARTVEGHIARICELLGVRTRLQAILKARDLELFHNYEP